MSLIADALKRAQEQRATGKGGKDPDDRARRMLTGSGPLRVGTATGRGVPRSVAVAGTVLAAALITFGGVVWLAPRAERGAGVSNPSNPSNSSNPSNRVEPHPAAAQPGQAPAAAGSEVGGRPAAGAPTPRQRDAEGTETLESAAAVPAPPVSAAATVPTGEASSFTLRLEGRPETNPAGPASASELFGRALGAQQAGDLEGAARLYRRAIEQNPTDAQLHNNLGTVYRALSMPGEALNAFRRAVEVDPSYAPAWSNLGIMLDGLGRDDEAIDAFREALRHDPSNTGARVNLANKYIAMGLPDEARSLLSDVLREEPALPEAHYAMARALEALGETDAAVRHYRVFLQLAAGRFPALEARVRGHLADLEGGGE